MHAFIFWGFVVLFPTIVIAVIYVVDREPGLPSGSPLAWLERQGWFALLVDLFCVLVLVGVATAFWIRKVQRPRRFDGSHLREADLILALIAGIVTTLLLWHGSQIALGLQRVAGRLVAGLERALRPVLGLDDHRGARARLRLDARADHPLLPRLPALLEAPAHRHRRPERLLRADAARAADWSRSTSRARTTSSASAPARCAT